MTEGAIPWEHRHLGRLDYDAAWALQRTLHQRIGALRASRHHRAASLLLEHPAKLDPLGVVGEGGEQGVGFGDALVLPQARGQRQLQRKGRGRALGRAHCLQLVPPAHLSRGEPVHGHRRRIGHRRRRGAGMPKGRSQVGALLAEAPPCLVAAGAEGRGGDLVGHRGEVVAVDGAGGGCGLGLTVAQGLAQHLEHPVAVAVETQEGGAAQGAHRAQGQPGARQGLQAGVAQGPGEQAPRLARHLVGRGARGPVHGPQDRHVHPGQALGAHHVVLVGGHQRRAVVRVHGALRRGDEAGAHLHAGVAQVEHGQEVRGGRHPACGQDRQVQGRELGQELGGGAGARVAPGPGVDGDQAVDALGGGLLREAQLGDVVPDRVAGRVHAVAHLARVAQGRDEEAHPGLEGLVDPGVHALQVDLRAGLDDGVEADRLVGQLAHPRQPGGQAAGVDVAEADRLHDPQAARLADRGHQLGVAAGVHGAQGQGQLDPGGTGERRLAGGAHRVAGPRVHSAVMVATRSPSSSNRPASQVNGPS